MCFPLAKIIKLSFSFPHFRRNFARQNEVRRRRLNDAPVPPPPQQSQQPQPHPTQEGQESSTEATSQSGMDSSAHQVIFAIFVIGVDYFLAFSFGSVSIINFNQSTLSTNSSSFRLHSFYSKCCKVLVATLLTIYFYLPTELCLSGGRSFLYFL